VRRHRRQRRRWHADHQPVRAERGKARDKKAVERALGPYLDSLSRQFTDLRLNALFDEANLLEKVALSAAYVNTALTPDDWSRLTDVADETRSTISSKLTPPVVLQRQTVLAHLIEPMPVSEIAAQQARFHALQRKLGMPANDATVARFMLARKRKSTRKSSLQVQTAVEAKLSRR
jgi:hypothetical protein